MKAMTTIENNPYYFGLGTYKGQFCTLYYDYNQKVWSVEIHSTSEMVEDADREEIDF